MSIEELSQKVDHLEKKEFRSTYIKAGSILLSACIVSATFGITLGDWVTWRREISKDMGDVKEWKKGVEQAAHTARVGKIKMLNNHTI